MGRIGKGPGVKGKSAEAELYWVVTVSSSSGQTKWSQRNLGQTHDYFLGVFLAFMLSLVSNKHAAKLWGLAVGVDILSFLCGPDSTSNWRYRCDPDLRLKTIIILPMVVALLLNVDTVGSWCWIESSGTCTKGAECYILRLHHTGKFRIPSSQYAQPTL